MSLNFHSSDRINIEKLQAIANKYMERNGFGNQSYIVYRHNDAGHLRLHTVTTNIQSIAAESHWITLRKLVTESKKGN